MVDRITADDKRKLAERLSAEAEATRPEFSEALHARVCRAIESVRVPATQPASGSRRRSGWWLAAVAVSLSIAAVWAWRWSDRPDEPMGGPGGREMVAIPSPDPIVDPGDDLDAAARPVVRSVGMAGLAIDSTVADGRWAYLDHDARQAVKLLKDQLPLSVASND